jgi:hypothetical protein
MVTQEFDRGMAKYHVVIQHECQAKQDNDDAGPGEFFIHKLKDCFVAEKRSSQ